MYIWTSFAIVTLFKGSLIINADADVWNRNHEVRDKLLKSYDKLALPQRNANGTTDVLVLTIVNRFWFDEDQQIFSITGVSSMAWLDERLKWNPDEYGGLKELHLGDSEIWKPDLYVYNNADEYKVDPYGNVHFLVSNRGFVHWFPPMHIQVNCPIDLKYWPFDEQNCVITLGSWTSHGWQINFKFFTANETKIRLSLTEESSNSWKIVEATQTRHEMYYRQLYISIDLNFKLKRNYQTYTAVAVVPAIVIPLILVVQFVLPVNHPMRLSIACWCAILVLLELLYIKYSLPKLGTSVPLIVIYYSHAFVMVMVTAAISAVLGRLANPQNPLVGYPPPAMLKRVLTGIPATILCLRTHANTVGLSSEMAEDGEVLDTSKTPTYDHEWLFVTKIVDRIAFILLICVYVFSLIGYLAPIK